MSDPNVIQLLEALNEAVVAVNDNLCWGVFMICLVVSLSHD